MAVERYEVGPCMAFMQFDVPYGVVIGGNPAPDGCDTLVIQVAGAGMRVRLDGQPCDVVTGHLVTAGTTYVMRLLPAEWAKSYFTCANDGVTTLTCHFFAAR